MNPPVDAAPSPDSQPSTNDSGEPLATELWGTWLSEGANVAPLLAGPPFNYASITQIFNSDDSYHIDIVETDGGMLALDGTYEVWASPVAEILYIHLTQTSPSAGEAEGMYDIDATPEPDSMTYEQVVVNPATTPPNAEMGFGSSQYNGQPLGDAVIQTYVRVP